MTSPELLFWYELALKMAMTAAIVVIASVAVERSGPFIGALIAALPTAAGAAYIILAMEHPPGFIAASAIGSLATNAAVSVFALSYAILAQRHGLLLSLSVATVLWFAIAAALRFVDWTPLTAMALVTVVFAFTIPLSWSYRTSGTPPKVARTPLDIPLRAITAAVLVAIVTTASYRIGSFASGMFAVFPIVLGSFIVILHPRIGGKASASVLAHAQIALLDCASAFWPCTILRNRSVRGGASRSAFRSASPGMVCCGYFALAKFCRSASSSYPVFFVARMSAAISGAAVPHIAALMRATFFLSLPVPISS